MSVSPRILFTLLTAGFVFGGVAGISIIKLTECKNSKSRGECYGTWVLSLVVMLVALYFLIHHFYSPSSNTRVNNIRPNTSYRSNAISNNTQI